MKLCIALATRNRPELLSRTIETTLRNRRRAECALVILLDHDDPAGQAAAQRFAPDVTLSIAPREDTLGAKYNRALLVSPADLYLTMVDYAPHATPGFDEKIVAAASLFEDGIGAVYNRHANLSFPGINAVTRKLIGMMGFIYPPYFPYWFVDHWLDDIAQMIGRIAFADVHLDIDKRPGTMERRDPAFWAALFDAYRATRRRQAQAIIAAPEFIETEARKRLLLNRIPLIEDHSTLVNMCVRATPGPGPEPDDRYRRIKTKAIRSLVALLPDILADNREDPMTHSDPTVQALITALETQRDEAMIAAAQANGRLAALQTEVAAIREKALAASEGLAALERQQLPALAAE